MKSYLNLLLLISTFQFAQNIELDTSFGQNGYFTTTTISQITKMLILNDNSTINVGYKIQSSGVSVTQLCLFKATEAGIIDLTFGINGFVNATIEDYSMPTDALMLPNNKILVSGYCKTIDENKTTLQKGIFVQYNSDGSLDTSFSDDGILKIDLANTFPNGSINSIAITSDNKIVALGTANGTGSFLLKYNSNGILDTTFGTNGMVYFNFNSVNYNCQYITSLYDDSILCGGSALNSINPKTSIIKFDSVGQLDVSFGDFGIVTIDTYNNIIPEFNALPEYCTKLIIQDDLKILIKGVSGTNNNLFRLLPNGTIDANFGTNGFVNFLLFLSNISIQTDAKIILSGSIMFGGGDNGFSFSRYNQDGTIDTTFNSNGIFNINPTTNQDYLDNSNLLNDGNLIGAGVFSDSFGSQVFITKYLINKNLSETSIKQNTFTISPNPTTSYITINFGSSKQKKNITLQNALGQIVSSKNFTNIEAVNYPIEGENGIYFLSLENENGEKQTHKIIKNK